MVTAVQERQTVSLELRNLLREPLKTLILPPPQPRPCPVGTQMLAKALPLLTEVDSPLTPTAVGGRDLWHLLSCRL